MRATLILPLLLATLTAHADFRSHPWGSTPADVKGKEELKPFIELADTLAYSGRVGTREMLISFDFREGRLVRGSYSPLAELSRGKMCDEFDALAFILTEKYGTHTQETVKWYDEVFKDTPAEYGRAIAMGHMEKSVKWETADTVIDLRIYESGGDIQIAIIYEDKAMIETIEQEMLAEAQEDF